MNADTAHLDPQAPAQHAWHVTAAKQQSAHQEVILDQNAIIDAGSSHSGAMPVEPAVVDTTITLQDDTEQLHSDVKKLMQELFPEQWGSVDADRMQVPAGLLTAVSKRLMITRVVDPSPPA